MRSPAGHPSLVGRREELAAIDASLTGDALGVVLVGEPGIGKSRLLEAAADRALLVRAAASCTPAGWRRSPPVSGRSPSWSPTAAATARSPRRCS
jgi:hypothetical protein